MQSTSSCQNQTDFACTIQLFNTLYANDSASFMRFLGAPLGLNINTDVR